MPDAALVVMSGLPGVGKSTLSRALARNLRMALLSVDPIEIAIIKSGLAQSYATGLAAYEVAAALAEQNLEVGQSVIVDAVNAVEIARDTWRGVSRRTSVPMRVIEVTCRDVERHRHQVTTRASSTLTVRWEDVLKRQAEWEPWQEVRLIVDIADANPLARMVAWLS